MTPEDVLREYYQQARNGETNEFYCKFCYKSYVKNVTRMCKHIVLCSEAPVEVKDVVLNCVIKTNLEINVPEDEEMDLSVKNRLWQKLALEIYASGSPFSLVENQYWINFFQDLKPSFKLPSRKALSTTLLDAEYSRSLEITNSRIEHCSAYGVQIDSWTNTRYEPVVNIIVTTPEPILYKSIYSKTDHHNGEYYAEQIKETILKCGKSRCLSVCTDNDSTMTKARRLVVNDPDLINLAISSYGCIAHWENLLINDILQIPSFSRIKKKINSIITHINGSQVLKERLKVIQLEEYSKVIALLLPVKTRWGYIVPSIQSVLNSRNSIEKLVNSLQVKKYLSLEVKGIVCDASFWIEAEQLCFFLEPIKKWISALESDSYIISKVPNAIKEISDHIKGNVSLSPVLPAEETQILDIVEYRGSTIMTAIHYASNILDPNCQGKILSENQKIEGCKYISKVSTALKCDTTKIDEELHLFMNRKNFYSSELLWNSQFTDNSKIWWSTFCAATELYKAAIPILSMPPTSAATERSFSTFSHIHTKKRNRLTTERAAKLVFIGKTHQTFKDQFGFRNMYANEMDESVDDDVTDDFEYCENDFEYCENDFEYCENDFEYCENDQFNFFNGYFMVHNK